MKKMISICFLLFAVFIGLVVVFFWMLKTPDELTVPYEVALDSEYAVQTETEEALAASVSIQKNYTYVLRVQEGRLIVYEKDGKTVYLETNIRYEDLDDEMKTKADAGITFDNDRELYEFLENYSS